MVTTLEQLRDELYTKQLAQTLKVQIVPDIFEVLFDLYDGKSPKEIVDEFFDIFKPTTYARLL